MSGNPYQSQGLAQNTQQAGTAAGSYFNDIASGQQSLANTDMTPYLNPYTGAVVNSTMDTINRNNKLQDLQTASDATQQNAFGGDRFAVQLAENARNARDQAYNQVGQLYNTGWNNAQNAASTDIANKMAAAGGLGQQAAQGFNWGQTLQQNQMQAGQMQQDQTQKLMDAIKAQYLGFTGQGQTGLNDLESAVQALGSAIQKSTTNSTNPSYTYK